MKEDYPVDSLSKDLTPAESLNDLSVHSREDDNPGYYPDYLLDDSYTREITYNNYNNVLIEPYSSIPEHLPYLSTPVHTRSPISAPQCDSIPQNLPSPFLPTSPDPEYSIQLPFANVAIPSHPSPHPSCSYIPTPSQQSETIVPLCTVCECECTGAHFCPGCRRPIHTICGQTVGDIEGYGSPVWCISCWAELRADDIQQGRLAAKRGQEKQIQRMIKQSNKRIKLVDVGQNVLIPIPLVDRRSPFDLQNIPGVILQKVDDGMYQIGTALGILDHLYTSSQFESSLSHFLSPEEVPDKRVTLRESILHSSFGRNKLQCNCTAGCNSNRCKCRRSNRICNSKCHKSLTCHNRSLE